MKILEEKEWEKKALTIEEYLLKLQTVREENKELFEKMKK